MRDILRNMARTNMKDFGMTRINKKRAYAVNNGTEKHSYFSQNWRRWINRTKKAS